ncbi:short chain dehydrogenase, partial [Streptomyces clavuligerus]
MGQGEGTGAVGDGAGRRKGERAIPAPKAIPAGIGAVTGHGPLRQCHLGLRTACGTEGGPADVSGQDIRERRVRTGGIELSVAERGDPDRPTIVLVHGYPDSKAVWSPVAERLADRFHVVAYDVRGHGRSTAPRPLRGGFTLEKLTDDFLAVADAVSPGRPVHLVGHDWGSVQSWEFVTVERAAARIASFTSLCGPSLDHAAHWFRARLSRPTPRGLSQVVEQGVRSWYVGFFHTPVLPELLVRGPVGSRWVARLERVEKVPDGDRPAGSLRRDALHGLW